MPEISRFFGVVVYMYFDDHAPPHFHAEYAGEEVLVRIDDLSIIRGHIHPRALGFVMEWASLHKADLEQAWSEAEAHNKPGKILPL
ncbi:MAG TPA: DUF4160 domain-containing protein [Candidatus Kapabacteria bacterium]|nr:DUF4160 domain-containing protein [Candidatus Kapabacteria bacterium]